MATATKKRNRTRGNTAQAARPPVPHDATPTVPPLLNTNFICAACTRKRPSNAPDGKALYVTSPNNDRICLKCLDDRDALEMEAGGVTLGLDWSPADQSWYAVNVSGKMRFKLMDKGAHAKTVGLPSFMDKGGNVWNGRLYAKSGRCFFQKTGLDKPKKRSRKAKA
jgi:hypothetical protein